MKSLLTISVALCLLVLMIVTPGCTCSGDDDDDDGGRNNAPEDDDDDDSTPVIFDDDDDDTTPPDDDDDDDTSPPDDDDDDDDDTTEPCVTSVNYDAGEYYMPIWVTLSADCSSMVYYMRERYDGSGDAGFIGAPSPIQGIYIDRDTTLRFYSMNEDNVQEQEQSIVYLFPPKFAGLVYVHSGDSKITLQWDAAWDEHGPISYEIYKPRTGEPIPTLDPIASTNQTKFTVTNADTSLVNGTITCFIVRAKDNMGMEDQNYGMYCLAPQVVIYVDSQASSGGDGSMGYPFNSIQDANDAIPGYFRSIWVAGGTYHENLDFTLNDPPNNTIIQNVQMFGGFDSSDWHRDIKRNPTVIDGGGNEYAIKPGEKDLIDGFQITNAQSGILIDNHSSITIRNCVVHHNTAEGLLIRGTTNYVGPSITSNLFVLNENGIGLEAAAYSGGDSGLNPLIRNNIIFSNNFDGIYGIATGDGTYTTNLKGKIFNSVIGSNAGDGVALMFSGTNMDTEFEIFNNYIGDNATDLACDDCLGNELMIEFSNILDPGEFTGVNILSVDPGFVSVPYNFHLVPESAMVDGGFPDSLFNDVDGSRNDMGAFGGPGGNWKPLPWPAIN